ncbi:GGDEF domain-containing protein [Marinomonas sp. TW1]|uniref:GGDEF domain-containing protein n=1 Tax=Marinomonas sp. TW1 TaxID=1561203 RepID=UPI0007AFC253|nr:GGDEF domain-containing protein [Marinomonas sp. TW1]KZN13290.1 diguanylate cyclase [Marinomonas sp. TW1]
MFSSLKKIIHTILHFGFKDDYANDVNQKHVVNFSYLIFCFASVFLIVMFSQPFSPLVVIVSILSLLFACLGLRYNYRGQFSRAQILMPILKMSQVTILTLFYFGSESGFHFLLVHVIAYSFIVFRADQRFVKGLIVAITALLFLMCEYLSLKGLYLTESKQSFMLVSVFFFIALYFSIVINLVMSRLKSVNQHLRVLAEKDELTGLSNRRKVLADAVNIFADCVINHDTCVFAIVDLDHFKKINDTYGHEAGDFVLAKVSAKMQSVIRTTDKIGRYGGEEFIILMPKTKLAQAELVMEHLRQTIAGLTIETEKGIIIPVTISIGLAPITSEVTRYEEILASADRGLYAAKRSGRNRVSVSPDFQD